jgi:hypothetical protein
MPSDFPDVNGIPPFSRKIVAVVAGSPDQTGYASRGIDVKIDGPSTVEAVKASVC